MARRRYCGMCDAWTARYACPACGADTDAPARASDPTRTVVDVDGTLVPVSVTRASRGPQDMERGWRVYGQRQWLAQGRTAQDALARARAVLLSRQRPGGFL